MTGSVSISLPIWNQTCEWTQSLVMTEAQISDGDADSAEGRVGEILMNGKTHIVRLTTYQCTPSLASNMQKGGRKTFNQTYTSTHTSRHLLN